MPLFPDVRVLAHCSSGNRALAEACKRPADTAAVSGKRARKLEQSAVRRLSSLTAFTSQKTPVPRPGRTDRSSAPECHENDNQMLDVALPHRKTLSLSQLEHTNIVENLLVEQQLPYNNDKNKVLDGDDQHFRLDE